MQEVKKIKGRNIKMKITAVLQSDYNNNNKNALTGCARHVKLHCGAR